MCWPQVGYVGNRVFRVYRNTDAKSRDSGLYERRLIPIYPIPEIRDTPDAFLVLQMSAAGTCDVVPYAAPQSRGGPRSGEDLQAAGQVRPAGPARRGHGCGRETRRWRIDGGRLRALSKSLPAALH